MKSKRAFTLIELLVVVSIIVLLIALIMPTLGRARETALQAKCGANLHSIGAAFAAYCTNNSGYMPQSEAFHLPGWDAGVNSNPVDPATGLKMGNSNLTWNDALYIDGDLGTSAGNKNGRIDNNASYHNPLSWEPLFTCPSHDAKFEFGDDGHYHQGYGMAWMATSDFTNDLKIRWTGLNQGHIVAAEGGLYMGRDGANAAPPNNSYYGVFQRHRKGNRYGANFLMADSHVEFSTDYGSYTSPGQGGSPTGVQLVSPTNIWVHP